MEESLDRVRRRNLWILWIGVFLATATFTMVMPFLPSFLRDLGVSKGVEAWSGLVFAAGFVLKAIFSPIWGRLADRYGRRPMLIRAGLGLAITYLLMSLVTSPVQLLIVRMASGVVSGFVPLALALMATNTPSDKVGRTLGSLQTAYSLGYFVLGPVVGGSLADLLGIRPTLLLASAAMACACLLVVLGVREPGSAKRAEASSLLADLRTGLSMPILLFTLVAWVLVQGAAMALVPILPEMVAHISGGVAMAWQSGGVIALSGVGSILTASLWGAWGQRSGFVRALTYGVGLASVLLFAEGAAGAVWQLGLLHFTFGLAFAAAYPSLNAIMALYVPENFRSRAFGMNETARQVGNALGPLLGGIVAASFGVRMAFVGAGSLLLLAAVWMVVGVGRPALTTKEISRG